MVAEGLKVHNQALLIKGGLNIFFTVFMIGSVALIFIQAVTRWLSFVPGMKLKKPDPAPQ